MSELDPVPAVDPVVIVTPEPLDQTVIDAFAAVGITVATKPDADRVKALVTADIQQQVREQLGEFRRFSLQWLNDGKLGTLADIFAAFDGGG